MEIVAAILCDHVSVREGLLMAIGGGITRLWREEMPAPVLVELAVILELTPDDHRRPHGLVVDITDADGRSIAMVQGGFHVPASDGLDPGETTVVPIPVKFPPMARIPAFGRYSVNVTIDDEHRRSLAFSVRRAPRADEPPSP